MVSIDYLIIILYFLVVISIGAWFKKRASKNLESYFLASKNMHWLPLAMSGSVSTFDITGTMWIVSILFVLGMKSMWHHWMWGVFMAAFFMSYMGKWVRRSNVMTAAEWMETRFGKDNGGTLARISYALMALVTLASFIGYAYQGIGKFASVYISLAPITTLFSSVELNQFILNHQDDILAIIIISITTFYVIIGGLYSVIVTDVFQTLILTIGSIFIAYLAWSKLTPELLSALPEDWTSLSIPWRIENIDAKNAEFEFFGALVIVWVLKGLLLNAGGPAQMYDFQRFLAARDPRDAAKVGAAWRLDAAEPKAAQAVKAEDFEAAISGSVKTHSGTRPRRPWRVRWSRVACRGICSLARAHSMDRNSSSCCATRSAVTGSAAHCRLT